MELKKSNELTLYNILVPVSGTATFEIIANSPEEAYAKLENDEILETAKYDITSLDIESAIVLIKPNKIKS